MPITINEMLSLPIFNSFNLVAGENGLSNYVKKVGIIDHETEDMIISNFGEGEFVLSTFFNVKDNPLRLYTYIQELIKANVSGLGIKDIYFNKLSQRIIDYANDHYFPIFIYSEVYYEDIITCVVDANKDKECILVLENKINSIKSGDLSSASIMSVANDINRALRENHAVAFCRPIEANGFFPYQSKLVQSLLQYNIFNSVIPYNNGILVILTFDSKHHNSVNSLVLRSLKDLGINSNNYYIGVSCLYQHLHQLYESINESLYAYQYAVTSDTRLVYFENMGVNRVLIPLLNNEWLDKYYEKVIRPIFDYDQLNDSNLLKTAVSYIENMGDIKATAKSLYQHSNTVRYRINKIRDILVDNNVVDFYQELSIAVSLYKLKKF